MEQKPDWADVGDDDEEEEYIQDQEKAQEEGENTGPSNQARTGDSANRGYRGSRGNRGGGRGGRGGRGGDRGRGGRGGARQEGRPERQQKESQPKQEMLNMIKHGKDEYPLINLFDVEYKATDEDIKKLYKDVEIRNINMIKAGLFLLELEKEEAIKLIEIGPKSINNRPFFMKLGYANKQQHPDEQWHTVNADKHKYDVGYREDKPRRGGKPGGYNRKEQSEFEEGPYPQQQRKPYQNRPRGEYGDRRRQEETVPDTDNKFFKGHDLTSKEFTLKFTKTSSSKREDEGVQEAAHESQPKPNPFGDARPRDENEYLKRKEAEDEKNQVKDLQEHFEEKKEELSKDNKKTLLTPVNSPNTEFLEDSSKEGKDNQAGDKGKLPPGISQPSNYGKGNKKSGFGGNQGNYQGKYYEKQGDYSQQSKYQGKNQQETQGHKTTEEVPKTQGKAKTANAKFNPFAALE